MKQLMDKAGTPKEKPVSTDDSGLESRLILYNDDYNTFDHVIESIMNVCELDHHQAEQITLLAHFKGKATCRKGIREHLEPMSAQLDDRGIEAEVK